MFDDCIIWLWLCLYILHVLLSIQQYGFYGFMKLTSVPLLLTKHKMGSLIILANCFI